jgi:hypothetical protein
MQEERGMATAQEIDPFLKADFPTRAPKRHGQSPPPPDVHQGAHPMTQGPSPTCHID